MSVLFILCGPVIDYPPVQGVTPPQVYAGIGTTSPLTTRNGLNGIDHEWMDGLKCAEKYFRSNTSSANVIKTSTHFIQIMLTLFHKIVRPF